MDRNKPFNQHFSFCMIDDTLKQIQSLSGLSQVQLASLFGVTRQALYKWLKGYPCITKHKEHILDVSVCIKDAHQRLGSSQALNCWLLTPTSPGGAKPLTYLSERRYDVFQGFLLRASAPSWRVYQERSPEDVRDARERLKPRSFRDDLEDFTQQKFRNSP
jgi:DNA-binding XRE family transcriptional regulator